MSSRKKPRPSFDLPEETAGGEQSSGWVYRSGNGSGRAEPSKHEAGSLIESGSYAIAYGIATMTQALALAMTIATLPLAIGARVIEDWASEGRSTSPAPPVSDAPSPRA